MASAFWPMAKLFTICHLFLIYLHFKGFQQRRCRHRRRNKFSQLSTFWQLSAMLAPLAIPFPSPIPFRFFRFLYFILYFLYSYLNTICNTYKRHSISTWSPNKGHSHWDFPHGMLSICHRRLWWAQSSAPSVSSSLICRPENVSALIKFCTDFQVDKRPYS